MFPCLEEGIGQTTQVSDLRGGTGLQESGALDRFHSMGSLRPELMAGKGNFSFDDWSSLPVVFRTVCMTSVGNNYLMKSLHS